MLQRRVVTAATIAATWGRRNRFKLRHENPVEFLIKFWKFARSFPDFVYRQPESGREAALPTSLNWILTREKKWGAEREGNREELSHDRAAYISFLSAIAEFAKLSASPGTFLIKKIIRSQILRLFPWNWNVSNASIFPCAFHLPCRLIYFIVTRTLYGRMP